MGTLVANWHDENNSRTINFSVAYEVCGAGKVTIKEIVPDRVTIVCPTTNTSLKTLKVYTTKGRDLLANQIRQSGRIADLQLEIAERRITAATA